MESFKDSRTLLDFTPLTIPLDLSTPITYNITMFKNSITNKVFSKTFTVPGDKLPLELIVGGYANQTRVYGPDFSSSGAYHLQAPFLKGNSNYIMKVEIRIYTREKMKSSNQFLRMHDLPGLSLNGAGRKLLLK